MAENGNKSGILTAITIGLLGIATGLFLGGNLLPFQSNGQLYDVRETITTTTTTIVDDTGEQVNTKQVKTTEKVPRGYPFTLALAGAGGGGRAGGEVQGPYDVWILERDFSPSLLTVPVGTTVTWTNKGGEPHTVTSPINLFDAGLDPGMSFSYTFTTPGVYDIICIPHSEMSASITVK